MKKITSLVLAVLMLLSIVSVMQVSAAETSAAALGDAFIDEGDFVFYACNGKAQVKEYSDTDGDNYARIPAEVDGCPVVAIGDQTFYNDKSLHSVFIPISVTSFGDKAFYGLSETLTIFYAGTKSDWDNIEIGSNNDSINTSNIVFCAEDKIQYKIVDGKAKIYGTNKTEPNIVVPDKIENCPVDEILAYAFYNIPELETVTLPESVETIGYQCFSYSNVKSVVFGKGLKEVARSAFSDVSKLTGVYYNGTSTDWNKILIGSSNDGLSAEKLHCLNIDGYGREYKWKTDGTLSLTGYHGTESSVTVPLEFDGISVTEIGDSAFLNNTNIKSVSVASSVKTIERDAFNGAYNLEEVTLSEGLEVIGNNAFFNTGITKIEIPSTVTKIGFKAFYFCENLSEVTLHEGLDSIEPFAFESCALTSIIIPDSVRSILTRALGYNYRPGSDLPVEGFIIYGSKGSAAERYATENKFEFIDIATVPTPITEIRVKDFVEPVAGSHPVFSLTPAGNYKLTNVRWFINGATNDDPELTDDYVFEKGKTYYIRVTVQADDGYVFVDNVAAFLNDETKERTAFTTDKDAALEREMKVGFIAAAASENPTEPTTPSSSETDPTSPSSSETDPTTPSSSETDPTNPSSSETDPTTPSSSETDPTTPSSSETDPTTPSSSETDPTTPSSSETNPTTPSEPEHVHEWSDWIVTQNATPFDDGEEMRECLSDPSHTETRPIAMVSGVTIPKLKYNYTGKAIKPVVTVKDSNGKKLVNGTDYEVIYPSKPVNAGLYMIDVQLLGKYEGLESIEYNIIAVKNPITVNTSTKTVKLSKVKKANQTVKPIKVSKANGKVTFKLTSVPKALKKLVKINSKGAITISKWAKAKKGIYKIKVKITAKGNKNYNPKSLNKTVTIKMK